jgi:tetratricopeptide (TPR) repeat protein
MFEIEKLNPAAIDFPRYVKTIMVLNNAAQQPDHIGHLTAGYGKDTTQSISTDSMAHEFCRALGEALVMASVFDDVRLCNDTMRRDSSFYRIKLFSAEEAAQICRDYGVDAFISLDKLFFKTKMHKIKSQSYVEECVEIELAGEIRAYWQGQGDIYTLPFYDTLAWKTKDDWFAMVNFSIADVQDAMKYMASREGGKSAVYFAPHWLEDSRWYYTSLFSEWKQGSAYASRNKWEEAADIWKSVLEKTKDKEQQSRLNANLALCKEMTGDFAEAIAYAEKAYHLFKESAGEENNFTKSQKLYIEALSKRAEDDKRLLHQLGEHY